MMNETLRVLKERRSIRKYKAEQIKDEELDAILEAGTWAASGKGLQSAVMVVVQDQETIAMLSRANAEIQGKPGADPFYGAPTAVVVLAARDYDPSFINRYLSDLAAAFHKFYNACRIKGEAENVLLARLKLADTARAVLKNGMTLIGCSAPEKM